jgi:hypothetical protein
MAKNPHAWNETIVELYGLDEAPPAVVNRNQFPDATKMVPTLSNRIALAVCPRRSSGASPCEAPCDGCRRDSAAVAHVIADWLRERHGGSSTTADLLDGVGCHQPDAEQSIQDGWRDLDRTQDPRMWPAITPGQEAVALAVGRELRRPNG